MVSAALRFHGVYATSGNGYPGRGKRHARCDLADPTNFALLTDTIRKNFIRDCRPMNVALSDRCGTTTFLLDRASGQTGSLETTEHRNNKHSLHYAYRMAETITCKTATIDSLIGEGLPAPHLMKIDVEGAEHLVLAQFGRFIRRRNAA
jgi:FkbM family methyltransferase